MMIWVEFGLSAMWKRKKERNKKALEYHAKVQT
jgi:hypothetical protein